MDEATSKCVNLRERFGRQYRISFDPAYSPKHVPRVKVDAWYMLIPSRWGEIWPYGGTTLAIDLEGRRARRLLATGVCRLYRDGDDGSTLLFDVTDFETVATIVKPRRRRVLSAHQRAKAADRLREHRFQPRTSEQVSGAT